MTKLPEKELEAAEKRPAEKKPPEKKTPEKGSESGFRGLLCAIGQSLRHNWPFKLVSVLLAIVLWSGLITQDPTLTREKAFTGVGISVTGEDSMKRNGFIVVSDLDEAIQDARMRVEVPQMQYANAGATNYNARIDLSRIKETGKQQVRVLTTSSSVWGSVIEISPDTVELEVEEYITRYRIPVTVAPIGEPPAGYHAETPSLDPPLVAVSGPRSLVDRIARAEATLDLSALPAREGLVRSAVPFRLLDSQGRVIDSKLLEVTSESVLVDSVVVEQQLYSTRELAMNTLGLTRGEPATGYEVKSVTVTPSVITAAGNAENLDVLDSLFADSAVDVTGASESFTAQIRVRQPSELTHLSSTSVTVAVEIGPVIRGKIFEDVRIAVQGMTAGYEATLTQSRVDVTISGPQLWVERLRGNDLTLTCDASGLTEGVYELPVICKVDDSDGITFDAEVLPGSVQVEIKKK